MSDEHDWDVWLEAIKDHGVNLTTWEEDFIESMTERREHGRSLSERQAEIIERVYTDRVP